MFAGKVGHFIGFVNRIEGMLRVKMGVVVHTSCLKINLTTEDKGLSRSLISDQDLISFKEIIILSKYGSLGPHVFNITRDLFKA